MTLGDSDNWALRAIARRRTTSLHIVAAILAVVLAAVTTPGILSVLSLRSMSLIASFLGIAAFGQTMCVLLGGIDLSIPFVIDAANVATLWLIDQKIPSACAVLIVLALAGVLGCLNGLVSSVVKGQAVVVTLGFGYLAVGGTQVVTSIGSSTNGAVFGTVPNWITSLAALRISSIGLPISPAVLIFVVIAIALGAWLRRTWLGRGVYALGGNPVAAQRLLVPEARIWMVVFAMSAVLSSIVGVLLLGFSGGAVASIGDPYLFLTVAAVAVGGSSLAGGHGGIGYTFIGTLILTLVSSVLVASVLSNAMQQVVLGLIIVPVVAVYGRAAHPRTLV